MEGMSGWCGCYLRRELTVDMVERVKFLLEKQTKLNLFLMFLHVLLVLLHDFFPLLFLFTCLLL